MKKKAAIITALLMIILSTTYGCTATSGSNYNTLKATDFKAQIAKERSEKDSTHHYRLAVLYSHYNNTRPDFKAAISEFKKFLKSKPNKGKLVEEARYKLDLLIRIVGNKETIRKLKDLDMTIEKRRKDTL